LIIASLTLWAIAIAVAMDAFDVTI
jgi:hypothetical protein